MKKYITLFSFAALFFVGFQQAQAQVTRAQELQMPEAIAKKQTHELHQVAELSGEQQRATYKILVDLNQNLKALESNDNINTVQEAKAQLMKNAKKQLKAALSEEQFHAYLKSLEKPKE